MAIDTAAKRYSMLSYLKESFGMRVPEATNMDDASDRLNELTLYGGLAAGGGGGGATTRRSRRASFWRRARRRR